MATSITIEDTSNATAIDSTSDWRNATNCLLDYWVSNYRCFSSGEVAAALRTHRPDLVFSVLSVGNYLRDLFYAGTLPQYVDQGMPIPPTQVPRLTEGKYPDRTSADVEVFVYCPTPDDGDAHDFEVFIPKPGETMADAPTPQPTQPKTQTQTLAILGAKVASVDIRAKVYDDKRMCVPRSAFELCVHLGGQPMQGGDPVYVKVEPDEAVITLTNLDPAAKPYDLSATRGRILFPSPDPAAPFVAGDVYHIKVDKGRLTIDLTTTANN